MNVQIIERDGNPEWAVIPYKEYMRLVAKAEMLQDVQAYDAALQAVAEGAEELIPAQIVYAILDGEHPYSGLARIPPTDPATVSRSSRHQYTLFITIGIWQTCGENGSVSSDCPSAQCNAGRYCQNRLKDRGET